MTCRQTILIQLIVLSTIQAAQAEALKADRSLAKDMRVDINEKIGVKELKRINAVPIELQNDEKVDPKFEAEKLELADLWDATLARSEDIQFVVNKLMPSSKPGPSNVMMKMLSAVVFGGMGAEMMMAPSMSSSQGMAVSAGTAMALTDPNLEPTYPRFGAQVSPILLPGLARAEHQSLQRKARISQEEAIMLYNMVRTKANKLASDFKNYSQTMRELSAPDSQSIADKIADARRYRSALVSAAGEKAVTKIDSNMGVTKLVQALHIDGND